MMTAFFRTVILYLLLIVGLRLTGKRQIGELEPIELVLTMLLSDLASVPMQDFGIPLLDGIIPIVTLLSMSIGNALGGELGMALAGTFCVIGHCFPLYFGFKGGKGVSVGAALALACGWQVFLGVIAVFLCVAVLSRKVSLGSVTASLCLPAAAAAFSCSPELITMAGFAALLVVFMHRSNIKRLISGKEPDFKPGKSV